MSKGRLHLFSFITYTLPRRVSTVTQRNLAWAICKCFKRHMVLHVDLLPCEAPPNVQLTEGLFYHPQDPLYAFMPVVPNFPGSKGPQVMVGSRPGKSNEPNYALAMYRSSAITICIISGVAVWVCAIWCSNSLKQWTVPHFGTGSGQMQGLPKGANVNGS